MICVKFSEILAAVVTGTSEVTLDFKGYKSHFGFGTPRYIQKARRMAALEVADMLEDDSVEVSGKDA